MAGADAVAGRRAAHQAVRARLATLDRLHREAAERRYCGASADGTVVADVDGTGRLRDLTIDPAVLRAADPERVGTQIVDAVTFARERAAADRAERIRQELGGHPAAGKGVEQRCHLRT